MKQVTYNSTLEITQVFGNARYRAYEDYYYSMRDSDAAEMLQETITRLDYLQAHEYRKFETRRAALESRRRELRAA